MVPTANPHRGEVELKFGEGHLILRCSYAALGKLMPLLMDPAPEIAERRMKWLTIAQEVFPDSQPPPLERWEWHNHLLGALAAQEADTVARAIKILAEERHPDLTLDQVMDQSPSWGLLWRPLYDLAYLFHWKPGEKPILPKGVGDGPFDLRRLLSVLSLLRSHTASSRPNSGA